MSNYNQHEQAVIIKGYETGGFPVGKRQLVKIFDMNAGEDFYDIRDEMRTALMKIEADNLTQEQISSAAHICAVVAYKMEPKS